MLLLNKKDRFALNSNDNKRMQSIGSIEGACIWNEQKSGK